MSNYRTVLTKLWNDKDVLATPKDGKLLFLYLITNKLINNSGVYEIPIATIGHETKIPAETVRKLFSNGSLKNIFYDFENEMVFVKNARRYHPGGNPAKVEKGILNEYRQTTKTPLWNLFLEVNPCFKDIIETVTEPLQKGSLPLPIPIASNNNKNVEFESEVLEVLTYLNAMADKEFRPSEENSVNIRARLKDKYTVADCKLVIDNKVATWKDHKRMDEYLRPITLFCKSKFDGYRNAKPKTGGGKETPGQAKRKQIEKILSTQAQLEG